MSIEPDGPGRHRPPSRLTTRGKTLAAAAMVSVAVLALAFATHRGGGDASAHDPATTPGSTTAHPTSAATRASAPEAPVDSDDGHARAALATLIAAAPSGGVSVAVRDVTTGREYAAGATGAMTLASAAKVEILETMLLQHDGALSGELDELATAMIEQSDNDAADDCFARLGGTEEYREALPRLRLDARVTTTDQGYYWGLNRTSATQQLVLMENLVDDDSPLPPAARAYALNLMRHVAPDQRWGVPTVADPGTTAANKNGWLNIDSDDGLWAVNSDGIVTVHGHVLLMSVLTQHNEDFDDGVARVDALVRQLAAAVLS